MKVRIKELAHEAKFIRLEESKIKSKQKIEFDELSWDFRKLNSHRKHTVREAARAAQLAYAFLRGIPYSEIEQKRKPDKEYRFINYIKPEVKRLVKKFGNLYTSENYDEEVEKWISET